MRSRTIRSFLADPESLPALSDVEVGAWTAGVQAILEQASACGLPELRDRQKVALTEVGQHRASLILGPPGTGKTAVLAWMAATSIAASRQANRPCRILVTAFTRSAIANLLEAIERNSTAIGQDSRIAFCGREPDEALGAGIEILDRRDLAEWVVQDYSVVGMTTWSILRAVKGGHLDEVEDFAAEAFDLLCLDEASQMKVSQGLSALAVLRDDAKIIVAGDDRQLAPIDSELPWAGDVRGIGGSLYGFLKSSNVPEFPLTETFRLNRILARPPAEFFYDEYESAVPDRRLQLADGWTNGLAGWLQRALDPDHPVCILLHEGPPASTRNPFEVAMVDELACAFAARLRAPDGQPYSPSRLWSEGFAVVSPHRAQNAAIRTRLRKTLGDDAIVETVDRIQGRERDAIILSYGVSDPEFAAAEGAFLFAPERFNVAITRPRSKLVVVVSRRLLEVLPADEGVLDAVQTLREFVFGSTPAETFEFAGGEYRIKVQIRLRRFDETVPLPEILPTVKQSEAEPPPVMTPDLEELEQVIRELAAANTRHGNAPDWDIVRRLARRPAFAEYRELFRLGRVLIQPGPKGAWLLSPIDDHLSPLVPSPESVDRNIEAVIGQVRKGTYPALYAGGRGSRGCRDFFVWCDAIGTDILWSQMERLQGSGLLIVAEDPWHRLTLDVSVHDEPTPLISGPQSIVTDEEFALLNAIEDLEIRRIDLGIVESWLHPSEVREGLPPSLAAHFRTLSAISGAVDHLASHGFLMNPEGLIRTRMAELAKELRYVKQRFRVGDEHERPFLVRALKVDAVTRDKPVRDQSASEFLQQLALRFEGRPDVPRVIHALLPTLREGIGLPAASEPRLSGFQVRAIEELIRMWLGDSSASGVVITADTGSGKTEAACLPLLFGAALDRLRGTSGARAVLVYPRIRLAVNQAARLARYARALGRELGVRVTLGLQSKDVPASWGSEKYRLETAKAGEKRLWRLLDSGRWAFPFFRCPECDSRLELQPTAPGEVADVLWCSDSTCGWAFDGWVGTKERIRYQPPALFLPVTESLHQWMMNPDYGVVFGDAGEPPKALLADEIHLYGQIHGAQVGWTLRRFLERVRLNGESRPLAIGMSATLGDPQAVWSELSGVDRERIVEIRPAPNERRENPRGREYFFFVQPEVESRGKDIAGASASIQSMMLLGHGMRRRTGSEGGYRALVFLDSLDKLKRLHTDFVDAEAEKRLAKLRTSQYGPDIQNPGVFRIECCGQPNSCGRFRDGECWYFAATDGRQMGASGIRRPGQPMLVAARPVSSQTSENVEEMIEDSDVVFATSSLEVGFDDPDVGLVYQHYAPSNLASFVQRKGRGGRGADDRPLTGVTLSIHSQRDAWYFQRPHRMLGAADFRVPINMDNHFVRKGQVIAAFLDAIARWFLLAGMSPTPRVPNEGIDAADSFIRALFGQDICEELEVGSLVEFWERVVDSATAGLEGPPNKWLGALPAVPRRLFDSINVPLLTVDLGDGYPKDEDVGLVLAECAPGRVSRRWALYDAHWFAPRAGKAPWCALDRRASQEFSLAPGVDASEFDKLIPSEVLAAAGGSIHSKILRPTLLRPLKAGAFQRSSWTSEWAWADTEVVQRAPEGDEPGIHHKSHGNLLGFVAAVEEPGKGAPFDRPSPALEGLSGGRIKVFLSQSKASSGLRVTQAYWGSDVELILDNLKRDRVYQRQIFTDEVGSGPVRLWGYGMQPEGFRITIEAAKLDGFVAASLAGLDAQELHWHRTKFLRYRVMTGGSRLGLTRFEASQFADLLSTAVCLPSERGSIDRAIRGQNHNLLIAPLRTAWTEFLGSHPQLPERRIDRLMKKVNRSLVKLIGEVLRVVDEPSSLAEFLRSSLLSGLLTRLRQLFVIHGRTDDRRVISHARPPVQFGLNSDLVITIAERGSGGDGTTRAFLEVADQVFSEWRAEHLVRCANAEVDEALDRAFSRTTEHERWRSMDPRSPMWVSRLADELGLAAVEAQGPVQAVLSLLYDAEEFGAERFPRFSLFGEAQAVRARMIGELGRAPTEWELVSSVVRCAAKGDDVPTWSRLRRQYANLEQSGHEGPLSPDARLADQVLRIGARLCFDGCLGCLYGQSDIMDEELHTSVSSRRLLSKFGWYLDRH